MKRTLPTLTIGALVLAVSAAVTLSLAHTAVTSNGVEWSPASPSIPEGVHSTVLYGDPRKDDPFALRLRFPADHHMPPRTNPRPEIITIIAGTFHFGMGEAADRENTLAYGPGQFIVVPAGTPHYFFTDNGGAMQLNSIGPRQHLDDLSREDHPRS